MVYMTEMKDTCLSRGWSRYHPAILLLFHPGFSTVIKREIPFARAFQRDPLCPVRKPRIFFQAEFSCENVNCFNLASIFAYTLAGKITRCKSFFSLLSMDRINWMSCDSFKVTDNSWISSSHEIESRPLYGKKNIFQACIQPFVCTNGYGNMRFVIEHNSRCWWLFAENVIVFFMCACH